MAVGCPSCAGTGYLGRTVLAEMLSMDERTLAQAIVSGTDVATLEHLALRSGMIDRWQRAIHAIEAGITSPAEVRRVLGFSKNKSDHAGY